ncbi:MAG: putative dehydrogenase [Conexibacter sp.]|nr:putative dehydrogenase [Conexibacter sp.]
MSAAETVDVALVGAGSVGQRHATVLSAFDDVRLVAVADVDAGRAAQLAARTGARCYADLEQLLERERLDALYICVPPFAHGPPERAALAAGLPFFVEKPLAADWATARTLADEVARARVPTGVGYHWRQLDTVAHARELLRANPARLAVGYWLDRAPPPPWWLDRRRSGGQTVEQATHVLDLLRLLVGEVTVVTALGAPSADPARADVAVDHASAATLAFASGAVGSLVCTCVLAAKHRTGVELFADGLAVTLDERELTLDRGDGPRAIVPARDARRAVDRDFLDAVRGERARACVDYREALATHRLACALARAAEHGGSVEVSDEALDG